MSDFPGGQWVGKAVSANDPQFTIPETNALIRDLIEQQRLMVELQEQFAEQQEQAASREKRIFWTALATLLATTAGVVLTVVL